MNSLDFANCKNTYIVISETFRAQGLKKFQLLLGRRPNVVKVNRSLYYRECSLFRMKSFSYGLAWFGIEITFMPK